MMKNNVKKIVVSLIVILFVIGAVHTAYATSNNLPIIEELLQKGDQNTNTNTNVNLEEIPEVNTNASLNTNTNTNVNTNTNTNENKPASTPYAGASDYTGLIFVVVFGAVAMYAYKKVRDYKA